MICSNSKFTDTSLLIRVVLPRPPENENLIFPRCPVSKLPYFSSLCKMEEPSEPLRECNHETKAENDKQRVKVLIWNLIFLESVGTN